MTVIITELETRDARYKVYATIKQQGNKKIVELKLR